MRKGFIAIFLVQIVGLTISCSSAEKNGQEQMRKFNNYIGESQANALEKATHSFDAFLEENFTEYSNENARIEAFLVYVKENGKPNDKWMLNTKTDSIIIAEFEESGLRKEIWLYGYEQDTLELDSEVVCFYNPFKDNEPDSLSELLFKELEEVLEDESEVLELDSITNYQMTQGMIEDSIRFLKRPRGNSRSKIPFTMAKFPVKDPAINSYIEVRVEAGDVSPAVVVEGLLWRDVEDYSKPYFKVMLVTEFYYYLMRWNLNRNGIYLYPKN